jgi:ParB-like chromosome segregation protein Spo0J
MNWHPFAEKFPLMEGEEWKSFKESIRQTKGPEQPVTFRMHKGQKQGLDGRNRYRACQELGIECPMQKVFVDENDVKDYIIRRNVHRRHLTREFRQELVAELRADGKSVRAIADTLRVGVGTVHRDIEAASGVPIGTPEIENPSVSEGSEPENTPSADESTESETPAPEPPKVTGRDGKTYPSSRPKTLAEQVDSDLAKEQEDDKPQTIDEAIKQKNGEIESFCRKLMKLAEEEMPEDPWLAFNNRSGSALQKIKDACSTLRSAKCHCACPMCQGAGCKQCHATGRVTKYVWDQLAG